MNTVRIFVSSPGDVAEERALAERVIDRLQGQDMGRVVLEPIFWEHEPLLATQSFQEQLPRAAEADVAVFILWGRLGTRLPEHITRPDGSRYASGTEFEFEDARAGWSATGKPAMLTYRKQAQLRVDLDDEESLLAKLAQKKALDEFEGRWFASADKSSLIGAFHPFTKPAEFEALFEHHLRALVKRHLPDRPAAESGVTAAWQAGSPFRGLETFEFEHARIFAGRTRAVGDVLEALRRQAAAGRAFVLVLGMSGGGKSSLVRAGVLPMLTRPGVVEGVGYWRRAVFRPSDAAGDLFDGLARALLRDEALPELHPSRDPEEAAELLRTAPQAAAVLIRQALTLASSGLEASAHTTIRPQARLALVVDQLEEIFTVDRVTADERERFLVAIDALARSGSVWVLATIRSDFYPRCTESKTLLALKEGAGQYDLQPPTAAEIGQMIRLPTWAAGLTFEGEPATGEHLADLLRDAASRSPGALPLLEFTLEEVYKRRTEAGMLTLAAYRGLGGLEGSLAQRAEEVFADLAPEVQAALPRVLNAVVSVADRGKGAVGRKRTTWESLATPEAKALVAAFVEARLFVSELADDGSAVVTVAHDALLDHWPRVGHWLEENREILRVRSRVWRGAELWETEGRRSDLLLPAGKPLEDARSLIGRPDVDLGDLSRSYIQSSLARERRRKSLKRALVAVLAVLTSLAAVAAFVANQQRGIARSEARRAEQRGKQAEDLIGFMLGDLREKLEPLGRLPILDKVGEMAMEYFAAVPEAELSDEELARRSKALYQIGDVRIAQGNLEAAQAPLEESLALAKALAERDPGNSERLFGLGQSYYWVGFVHWRRGKLKAALADFESYSDLASRLLALDAKNVDWQLEMAYAHSNIGSVLEAQGDLDGALARYRACLAIESSLAASDPANGDWQRAVAASHNAIGEVLRKQGNLADALVSHQEELAIHRALTERDPENAAWRQRLAVSHNRVGDLDEANGDLVLGRQHFGAAVEILEGLVERDPSNRVWQRELATNHRRLAAVLAAEKRWPEALVHFHAGVEMLERLAVDNPTDAGWQRDAAEAHIRFGEALCEGGNLPAAEAQAREALEILKELASGDPEALRLAGLGHLLQGNIWASRGDGTRALAEWALALANLEPLARDSEDGQLLEPLAKVLLYLDRVEEARPYVEKLRRMGFRNLQLTKLAASKGLVATDR